MLTADLKLSYNVICAQLEGGMQKTYCSLPISGFNGNDDCLYPVVMESIVGIHAEILFSVSWLPYQQCTETKPCWKNVKEDVGQQEQLRYFVVCIHGVVGLEDHNSVIRSTYLKLWCVRFHRFCFTHTYMNKMKLAGKIVHESNL